MPLGDVVGQRLARDELGRSALHLAASAGHVTAVRALLAGGAARERDAPDHAGCTPLQRAAADGHDAVVRLLLTSGALLDKHDQVHGNSALHEAAWKGYSRTVAILAAAGANLQLSNSGGFTALHLCCQNGHNQSCRELLLAGCNPDLQNNYGDTSLHTAARYGHAGVTRILISAQCKVSDQNKNGDTALHIAAAMGRRKLTRILLEAGCDRNVRNKQHETAMDIAVRKDLNEIVVILENTKVKNGKKKEKEKEKTEKPSKKSKRPSAHPHFSSAHWSPYGCHYYPDSAAFPKPRLDSLPGDPLRSGEQYFLDLAGNIRKGPVGVGYTCYCAPLFQHMEQRLDRDKKEMIEHIDEVNKRLGCRVAGLEHRTRGEVVLLRRSALVERRLRHLEQWLARGVAGRRSERAAPAPPAHHTATSTLTRSQSLELLDHVQRTALPPAKSLDELEVAVEQEVYDHGISSTNNTPSSSFNTSEPRRTVAEIVAHLQGRISPHSPQSPNSPHLPSPVSHVTPPRPIRYTPDIQWSHTHPQIHTHSHGSQSESSDDEDHPLKLSQLPGPMRDSNLAQPNYENVGTYRGVNGGTAPPPRTRSGVYSPSEVTNSLTALKLLDSETNNDSGYSTKVYGSSKGNSPSLVGPKDAEKAHVQRIGASSLV